MVRGRPSTPPPTNSWKIGGIMKNIQAELEGSFMETLENDPLIPDEVVYTIIHYVSNFIRIHCPEETMKLNKTGFNTSDGVINEMGEGVVQSWDLNTGEASVTYLNSFDPDSYENTDKRDLEVYTSDGDAITLGEYYRLDFEKRLYYWFKYDILLPVGTY